MLWRIQADTRMTRIGIMVIDLGDSTARATPDRLGSRARRHLRDGSPELTALTPAAKGNHPNRPNLPNRSANRRIVRKPVAEIAGNAEIELDTVTPGSPSLICRSVRWP